jgi:hypothetical protein
VNFNLADAALQLDPTSAQLIQAAALKKAKSSDALAAASGQANRLNNFEAIAQMANNPGLGRAASVAAAALRKQHSPVAVGNQGFALPSSGEFVTSPIFEQEQQESRASRAALQADRIAATQAAARQAGADRMQIAQMNIQARQEAQQQAHALRMTLAAMGARDKSDKASAASDLKAEKENNAALQKYSAAVEKAGLPAIEAGMRAVTALFEQKKGKDIEGYGAIAGGLPNWAISKIFKALRWPCCAAFPAPQLRTAKTGVS